MINRLEKISFDTRTQELKKKTKMLVGRSQVDAALDTADKNTHKTEKI